MNALHSPAHFELEQVFSDFAADPEQWVKRSSPAPRSGPFPPANDLAKAQAAAGLRMANPPTGSAGITTRYDLTCR